MSVCEITAVNKTACFRGACSLILEKGNAFFFFFNFIYLLLAVLDVHCRAGFSLVAESGGYMLAALQGFVISVASLVVEHPSRSWGFSSCGSWALEHRLSSCGAQAYLVHGV